MKCRKYIIILILLISQHSCFIQAGLPVLRCYGRLNSTYFNTVKGIEKLWIKYPDNRVNYKDIKTIRDTFPQYPRMMHPFYYPDTCDTCLYAFKYEQIIGDNKKPLWYLKSNDGSHIFLISIANCKKTINTGKCDICLSSVMILDRVSLNFRNWTMSRQERRNAIKFFKTDILKKLKAICEKLE